MRNLYFFTILFLAGCAATKKVPYAEPVTNRVVQIQTTFGNMTIHLSDSTPLHRDNFIKLVKQKSYDSLMFHRIIQGFMIQGGDPNSKNAAKGIMLGNGGLDYLIPAEFKPSLFHKRGVLAAARGDHPEKASNASQFYLVHGKKWTDAELDQLEITKLNGKKYSLESRDIYKTIGGAAQLDTNYTVFGEVVEGLDVIDKIAVLPKDRYNRPIEDVRMKIIIIR
jgi:peptidyl-prolyl cis-trans isomerase B (cyclophilin B)